MIQRDHGLPLKRQAELLELSRGSLYYQPEPVSAEDLDLMRLMGIETIYRRQNTPKRHPEHSVFPYLLRGLRIDRPN